MQKLLVLLTDLVYSTLLCLCSEIVLKDLNGHIFPLKRNDVTVTDNCIPMIKTVGNEHCCLESCPDFLALI